MREIKFRAWDGNKILEPQDLSQSGYYWKWLGKKDVFLMQFTGLLDKNGKEIYDGDILEFNDEQYTKFGWGKVLGQVVWTDCSFEVSMIKPKIEEFWDLESNEQWQIIGNMYENPELLNAKQ